MKTIALNLLLILVFALPCFAQICDETGSYNEVWTKEARARESHREEKQKYYKTLTPEQQLGVSDYEVYPTALMKCGMGFSNGLGKIFVDGKAGFINAKGEIVIKPRFKDAGRFQENLAPVELENGKWGYINKKGKLVIKPVFDWALMFREGRALVQVGKKWGYIDNTGEIIIKPQFDHADSFSEGLAHVQLYREKYYSGYIDKNGEWAIQPTWVGGGDFVIGKAKVSVDVKDDKGKYRYTECFYIDRTGKKLDAVDCSGWIRRENFFDDAKIQVVFEDDKTGYRDGRGGYIWKPTK
jgi:hypothetical protein